MYRHTLTGMFMAKEVSLQVIRSKKRNKITFVNMFGGKCIRCGYDKCVDALEFHHIDETTKSINPSIAIYRWSFDRAFEELKKCILICANCHRELHSNVIDLNYKNYLQKKLSVWYKKFCNNCNQEYNTTIENQKFCSYRCSSIARRIVKRPSKEELAELIEQKTTWLALGKMYGVSDNAVRKWARKYELI